jgi:hypothetical protein
MSGRYFYVVQRDVTPCGAACPEGTVGYATFRRLHSGGVAAVFFSRVIGCWSRHHAASSKELTLSQLQEVDGGTPSAMVIHKLNAAPD